MQIAIGFSLGRRWMLAGKTLRGRLRYVDGFWRWCSGRSGGGHSYSFHRLSGYGGVFVSTFMASDVPHP